MTSTIGAAPGPPRKAREGNPRGDSVRSPPGVTGLRGSPWPDAGTRQSTTTADIAIDPAAPYGYTRAAALQARFEQSAASLLASDGWSGGGTKELVADLALEGGGVKGIGIVGAVSVLAEAGYRFARVAGTSAGAIAAALIAAISTKGSPMTSLRLEEGRSHDEPEGLPRRPGLHRVHATQGQAARVHGPPLRERRREAVRCRGPRPPDGRLRRRLPRHVAGPDHGRPRRAHLRRPQDHDGGRSRHEPPAEPPLRARRAHVRHHPRPTGPLALGLRLLRAEP